MPLQKARSLILSKKLRNSIWSVSDAFLFPMLMLLFSPFFIKRLGIEEFGIWAFINSMIAGLGVLNFGLSDSIIRYVSKYRGISDDLNKERVANGGLTYSFYISCLVAVVILIICTFLFLFLPATTKLTQLIPYLLLWGGLTFSLKLSEQSLLAIPKGHENYQFSSSLSMTSKLLLFALNLIVIGQGGGLVLLFQLSFLLVFAIVFVEYLFVSRNFSVRLSVKMPDRATFKEMFSYGMWSWGQSLNGILSGQADRILVGILGGPALLGYYSIASMVSGQLHTVFSAASQWVFPSVSKKIAEGKEVRSTYYRMQFLISGGGFLAIFILMLVLDPLMLRWLGADVYTHSSDFIKVFLVYNAFSLTSIIPYFFMNGSGFVKLNTVIGFSSSVLNLIGMIIGYFWLGPVGFVAGRFLTPLSVSLLGRMVLHKKVLHEKSGIWGLLLLFPSFLFFNFLWLTSPLWLLLNGLLVFVVFGLYFYRLKNSTYFRF